MVNKKKGIKARKLKASGFTLSQIKDKMKFNSTMTTWRYLNVY